MSLFQSVRLTYRTLRSSDIDEIYAACDDPETQEGLSLIIAPKAEKLKDKLKTQAETRSLYVAAINTKTNEFIGSSSLNFERMPRDALLTLLVKRGQWGKGYGTEIVQWIINHGFKFLNAHRISLEVFENNSRAISLYERLGFVKEGTIRRARFVHGRWEDVFFMGILDEEFFEKETTKQVAEGLGGHALPS